MTATKVQKLLNEIGRKKRYNRTIFKSCLKEALSDSADPEKNHARADDLLVQTLENEGYDCTLFKNAELWCA